MFRRSHLFDILAAIHTLTYCGLIVLYHNVGFTPTETDCALRTVLMPGDHNNIQTPDAAVSWRRPRQLRHEFWSIHQSHFLYGQFLPFSKHFLEPGSKVVKEVIYIYNICNKCITHLNASNQQARLAFNAKNLLKVFEVLLLHLFKRCLWLSLFTWCTDYNCTVVYGQ